MTLNRKKKIILLSMISALLIISLKHEELYMELSSNEEYFADYTDGHIYIGNKDYIKSLKEEVSDKDILVVDERLTEDPNMIILNSYKVEDQIRRKEIIKALIEYELMYPTEWNRTEKSMLYEWEIHNILYNMNYKRDHTTSVDLNNKDQNIFNSIKELKKII